MPMERTDPPPNEGIGLKAAGIGLVVIVFDVVVLALGFVMMFFTDLRLGLTDPLTGGEARRAMVTDAVILGFLVLFLLVPALIAERSRPAVLTVQLTVIAAAVVLGALFISGNDRAAEGAAWYPRRSNVDLPSEL